MTDTEEMVEMTKQDANDLDEVVNELGIAESDTTPAEAVRQLKAELEAALASAPAGEEKPANGRNEVMWCTDCGARFTDDEIKGWGCPKCGSQGIPCDVKKDVTIEVNWHELRILVMWAENWAQQHKNGSDPGSRKMPKTVAAIARRLQGQHPTLGHLTFSGEIAALPSDLERAGIKVGKVETNIAKPELLQVNGSGAVGHSLSARSPVHTEKVLIGWQDIASCSTEGETDVELKLPSGRIETGHFSPVSRRWVTLRDKIAKRPHEQVPLATVTTHFYAPLEDGIYPTHWRPAAPTPPVPTDPVSVHTEKVLTVPDGWRLVPIEPTNEVLDALAEECRATWGVNVQKRKPEPFNSKSEWRERVRPFYKAALATPPVSTDPVSGGK